jgi:hypothetical protein
VRPGIDQGHLNESNRSVVRANQLGVFNEEPGAGQSARWRAEEPMGEPPMKIGLSSTPVILNQTYAPKACRGRPNAMTAERPWLRIR